MTLILGMSKAEGVYLSVDYRVTDARTRRLIDDTSTKFLHATYPPDKGGPAAVFAYTGLAILPDGTPTGTWLRGTLRGETEVFNQSMAHLRGRLDRDIAPLRIGLTVNVAVIHGTDRYWGGFSNIKKNGDVLDTFEYALQPLDKSTAIVNGSGSERLEKDGHLGLMRSQLNVRPRRIHDHMNLLAAINRRVAAKDDRVSPYCHVTFFDEDREKTHDKNSPRSKVFLERGEEVPFEMPTLLLGIDISGIAKRFFEHATAQLRGEIDELPPEDPDVVNEEFKRRP